MFARLVLVLLALGLIFGGIFGWKYHQAQQMNARAAAPPPPATVSAVAVRQENWQPYLYAVGSLVATQGIHVNNEVAGQVLEIRFKSGQEVQKGELLLRLDDSVDQAALEGRLAESRLAKVDFRRKARLLKNKSVSRSEYDEARATLDNAGAQVASGRALIEKKKIRAPFTGLLGIRQVDLGEYLAPGSNIVPLEALDPIFVDYSLPERNFAALSVGQAVAIEVQAYPGQRFEGRIQALNPGIDPGTRSIKIRAIIENSDARLRPGMFAQVSTVLPKRQGLLTLPQTAITYNPYGDSVFVVENDDGRLQVQRRQIKTGEVREGRVEVVTGLELGEQVVSAGHVKLRNGQQVKLDKGVKLAN